MDDDVIVTSFKFSAKSINISNSMERIKFILGTNVQQHNVHITVKVKVNLAYAEGHR